jgi:putrescine aminotransferase
MRDTNFLIENNARRSGIPWRIRPRCAPTAARHHEGAEGACVTDLEGRTVLDAVGGLWNVNLGYSCDPMKQAIRDQLDALPYYSGFRGTTNSPSIELAWELTQFFAPEGLVARLLHLRRLGFGRDRAAAGPPVLEDPRPGDRTKFLALKKGYHGTHFGGASVNGNANFRRNYEPLLPGVFHIPAPYAYRNPFDETDPAKLAKLCARALEDEIAFQGARHDRGLHHGAGAGRRRRDRPARQLHAAGARDLRPPRHLLIADEVITGLRPHRGLVGIAAVGVKPDMMAIAKAITSGYFPLGATMIGEKVAEVFEADKTAFGSIGHGYTYSGHPVGCAAGVAALAETRRLKVDENAAARGLELAEALEGLKRRHAVVGDIRYKGLMAALELVSDRDDKKAADKGVMKRVSDVAYDAGVMLRVSGSNIILSPPLTP